MYLDSPLFYLTLRSGIKSLRAIQIMEYILHHRYPDWCRAAGGNSPA